MEEIQLGFVGSEDYIVLWGAFKMVVLKHLKIIIKAVTQQDSMFDFGDDEAVGCNTQERLTLVQLLCAILPQDVAA